MSLKLPLAPGAGSTREKVALPVHVKIDPLAFQVPENVPAIVLTLRFSVGCVQLPWATPAFETALNAPVTLIPGPAFSTPPWLKLAGFADAPAGENGAFCELRSVHVA